MNTYTFSKFRCPIVCPSITLRLVFAMFMIAFLMQSSAFGHGLQLHDLPEKEWKLKSGKTVFGHFHVTHKDTLVLEKNNGTFHRVPLNSLAAADREFVSKRELSIQQINHQLSLAPAANSIDVSDTHNMELPAKGMLYLISLLILALLIPAIRQAEWTKRWFFPALSAGLLLISGFTFKQNKKLSFDRRVSYMDSAFSYFKPDVNTRSDANWYYVESLGLPDHETMLGIKAWQQQVPIPQCYIGSNAWSIPLHPQIASSPVPVNTKHFLRGAIAIAVNGIAIFSPYTNTGVDAYLDGQLDQYGGHSGRADDYHYHTAPTVLFSKVPANSPLAFALDGFAIFGNIEPDGQSQLPLDSNHGHYGLDGIYHYHISTSAPYMIKNMVGKVTEDSTMQIIPQATAKGCRPALTPLKGATITRNIPYPGKNGFVLTYTLGNNNDTVDYSWTPQGNYTFVFKTPTSKTTSNYKGNAICTVPLKTVEATQQPLHVFSTPEKLLLLQSNESIINHCSGLKIINTEGKTVFSSPRWQETIPAHTLSSGTYWIQVRYDSKTITKKFIVF